MWQPLNLAVAMSYWRDASRRGSWWEGMDMAANSCDWATFCCGIVAMAVAWLLLFNGQWILKYVILRAISIYKFSFVSFGLTISQSFFGMFQNF
jgi:hypothetical protein